MPGKAMFDANVSWFACWSGRVPRRGKTSSEPQSLVGIDVRLATSGPPTSGSRLMNPGTSVASADPRDAAGELATSTGRLAVSRRLGPRARCQNRLAWERQEERSARPSDRDGPRRTFRLLPPGRSSTQRCYGAVPDRLSASSGHLWLPALLFGRVERVRPRSAASTVIEFTPRRESGT